MQTSKQLSKISPWYITLALVFYAALAAGYFILRYGGQWADPDTAILTRVIGSTSAEGTIFPTYLYGFGYGYPSLSTFVLAATGLTVNQLQLLIYPFFAVGLCLVAFVTYRELTGDLLAGGLATLLLFMQPEFLFVISRGSHEKLTWLMVLLAVFFLSRTIQTGLPFRASAALVIFLYAALYGAISSNAFFGSAFIIALFLSLFAGFIILRVTRAWRPAGISRSTVVKLLYVTLTALVIWYLNTFILYAPSSGFLNQFETTGAKAVAVGTGQAETFDPYAAIVRGWASQGAYLSLALPGFILAGLSFAVWLFLGLQLLRRRAAWADARLFLLWLLYGSFGLQMVASLLADQVGMAAGNLQSRFFPIVMLFGLPLVAWSALQLWQRLSQQKVSPYLAIALTLFLLWAGAASLLKATNDPNFSNYWMFWTSAEDATVRWVEEHQRNSNVWFGIDGIRLGSRVTATSFGAETGNRSDNWILDSTTRLLVVSNNEQALSARRSVPLPDIQRENRVYDNGAVASYRFRARTPYQK